MSDVVVDVVASLNEGDLEAFVACYAADATIEDGYDRVAVAGHAQLRERYGAIFEQFPDLQVEPGWRTAVGDFVVQEERVSGRPGHERHVAIYLIANGVIARERLIA